jgi:hypothetical protein
MHCFVRIDVTDTEGKLSRGFREETIGFGFSQVFSPSNKTIIKEN